MNAALLVMNSDSLVHRAAVEGHLLLAAWVIGSYVFGAVWDSRNVMQAKK